MRKPNINQDFDNGDGTHDYEGYCDAMDDYADAMRDDEIERIMQADEEKGKLDAEDNR